MIEIWKKKGLNFFHLVLNDLFVLRGGYPYTSQHIFALIQEDSRFLLEEYYSKLPVFQVS